MRIQFIDIIKGILIVFVVLGHLQTPIKHEIYWFHMPAFFFLGGSLFTKSKIDLLAWIFIKKNIRVLLIPYFSFFLLILGIKIVSEGFELITLIKDLARVFVGGRALAGWWTPFWFINVLFVVRIIFFVIIKLPKIHQYIILAIIYVFATLYSYLKIKYSWDLIIPFSLDTSAICLIYFALGYYLINILDTGFLDNLKYYFLGSLIFIFLLFFVLNEYKLELIIDLKADIYDLILINVIVPLSFYLVIVFISKMIKNHDILRLSIIGNHTLTIMYLHVPVIIVLQLLSVQNTFLLFLISLVVSLGFSIVTEKNRLMKYLFHGK